MKKLKVHYKHNGKHLCGSRTVGGGNTRHPERQRRVCPDISFVTCKRCARKYRKLPHVVAAMKKYGQAVHKKIKKLNQTIDETGEEFDKLAEELSKVELVTPKNAKIVLLGTPEEDKC